MKNSNYYDLVHAILGHDYDKVFSLVIDNEMDLNKINKAGRTPISYTFCNYSDLTEPQVQKQKAIFELLIDLGADVAMKFSNRYYGFFDQLTALNLHAQCEYALRAHQLRGQPIDLNDPDSGAFEDALVSFDFKMVRLFLKYGADPNLECGSAFLSPLNQFFAALKNSFNNEECTDDEALSFQIQGHKIFRELLKRGALINDPAEQVDFVCKAINYDMSGDIIPTMIEFGLNLEEKLSSSKTIVNYFDEKPKAQTISELISEFIDFSAHQKTEAVRKFGRRLKRAQRGVVKELARLAQRKSALTP